jgi:LemA protein
VAAFLSAGAPAGCGYNEIIDRDEDVKAGWAEVQNQYQRRSDLVPTLVKVVKGERRLRNGRRSRSVVDARAKVRGRDRSTFGYLTSPREAKQFEERSTSHGRSSLG